MSSRVSHGCNLAEQRVAAVTVRIHAPASRLGGNRANEAEAPDKSSRSRRDRGLTTQPTHS